MKNIFIPLYSLLFSVVAFAQQEKDSIQTEVINVVTSYTPEVSDAFKAKENPVINTDNFKKKEQAYSINSKPVKSVFEPSKGTYKTAILERKSTFYPNYVKAGFGNYTTPLLEAFIQKKKKEHNFSFNLFNKSSKGGIDNLLLENNYLNTQVGARYKNTQKKYTWETGIAYHKDIYNLYGLPSTINYTPEVLESIDQQQNFNTISLDGSFDFKNKKLKTISAELNFYNDAYSSSEVDLNIESLVEFPAFEDHLLTTFDINLLNGSFKKGYETLEPINYGFLTFGAHSFYPIQKEDLFLSFGAKIKYNADLEGNNSAFLIYPDIKIEYAIIEDLLSTFGGINGDLQQNTYRNLSSENPYVAPTLFLQPTNNQLNLFAGLKGKLSTDISYTTKVSYIKESDKALFYQNRSLTDGNTLVENSYEAGNSFGVLYDDVTNFEIFAKIDARIFNSFTTGASITLNSYSLNTQAEAWNLPTFESSLFLNYTYEKWTAGTNLFLVGNRKSIDTDLLVTELDSYLDLNFNTTYNFTQQFSAFIDLNNVLNSDYETYTNYNVQGFQVMAGATYKFDFK